MKLSHAAWTALLAGMASAAAAETLTATVSDRSGSPLREIVVYAIPEGGAATMRAPAEPAVMDQIDQRFEPHILVVQTGTPVAFPNSDSVNHHVHLFSAAKSFELPLYKGDAHAPVIFDVPGIVDLGCNIHDQMEAHIVVVETPYFAQSRVDGRAILTELPRGRYRVGVYTPRLSPKSLPEPIFISLEEANMQLPIQIEERLRPPHSSTSESLIWSHY